MYNIVEGFDSGSNVDFNQSDQLDLYFRLFSMTVT